MDVTTVSKWFSTSALLIAVFQLGTGIVLYLNVASDAGAYLTSAIITGFIGGTFGATSLFRRPRHVIAGGMREMVCVLLVFWIILPFFAGLPFFFTGYGFFDAWFEAVSAMTTTGAWLDGATARASDGGLIWRALLQWGGGLVSLAAAAAIFIRPEFIGVDTIQAPFAGGENRSYPQAFAAGLRVFAPLYTAFTLFFTLVFIANEIRPLEAGALSMSLLSSGGFIPSSDGLTAYPRIIMLPVMIAMLLSASNFLILAHMASRQRPLMRLNEDYEMAVFLMLVLVVGGMLWVSAGAAGLTALTHQIFNAVSYFSTNGITYGQAPAMPLILVTTLIGGAAVSTAGGLKVLRWIVTFRRAGVELWKLSHPHAIPRLRETSQELGIWIHFICFTVFSAFLVLAVTLFGHNLETGMITAVAVISNAGPILAISQEGATDYNLFHPILRLGLALGMVFGRLEMVIALAAFNYAFWKS